LNLNLFGISFFGIKPTLTALTFFEGASKIWPTTIFADSKIRNTTFPCDVDVTMNCCR
jgi:hypothetical protein